MKTLLKIITLTVHFLLTIYTAIISVSVITLIFLYVKFNPKLSKITIIYSVAFIVLSLVMILFFFKKNSAIGRGLIWENTMNMILQKPILGWTDITFESQYMLQQASYFKNYPNSSYVLLADNVSHPFNEFLFFLFQYGSISMILLISITYRVYKNRNKSNIIYLLSILSILIFGCFSYPFRYPFVWIILALCLAQISNHSKSGQRYHEFHLNIFSKALGSIITLTALYFLIKDIRFEYNWNKTAQLSLIGNTKEMLENYKKLYDNWNGNPLFLYNYAAELNYIQDYENSIQVLSECIAYWNDYDVQMILADNYLNLEKWELSKKSYELASNMCPNRFEPLYKLHQINIKQGYIENANFIAKKIVSMDIKIPSSQISFIKKEMELYLHGQ